MKVITLMYKYKYLVIVVALIPALFSCSSISYNRLERKLTRNCFFTHSSSDKLKSRKEIFADTSINHKRIKQYLLIEYDEVFNDMYWGLLCINEEKYYFVKDSASATLIVSPFIKDDELLFLVERFNKNDFERIKNASKIGCKTSSSTRISIICWKSFWLKKWIFSGCTLWINIDGSIRE